MYLIIKNNKIIDIIQKEIVPDKYTLSDNYKIIKKDINYIIKDLKGYIVDIILKDEKIPVDYYHIHLITTNVYRNQHYIISSKRIKQLIDI